MRVWKCLSSTLILCLVCVTHGDAGSGSRAQESNKADVWAPLEFLVGDWVGEGSGEPGRGSGGFTFKYDLDKKILVRINYAEYPATKDRAAFTHRDLMLVYPDSTGHALRAIYFDNEGHVINYSVSVSQNPEVIRFTSDPSPSSPRYRLSYAKTSSAIVSIRFEIAPPGKPDVFSAYIEAVARRR